MKQVNTSKLDSSKLKAKQAAGKYDGSYGESADPGKVIPINSKDQEPGEDHKNDKQPAQITPQQEEETSVIEPREGVAKGAKSAKRAEKADDHDQMEEEKHAEKSAAEMEEEKSAAEMEEEKSAAEMEEQGTTGTYDGEYGGTRKGSVITGGKEAEQSPDINKKESDHDLQHTADMEEDDESPAKKAKAMAAAPLPKISDVAIFGVDKNMRTALQGGNKKHMAMNEAFMNSWQAMAADLFKK